MSDDTPITDDALEALESAEFVTEYREGSNSAKRLTPSELRELYELEKARAMDANRATNGIYRRIVD